MTETGTAERYPTWAQTLGWCAAGVISGPTAAWVGMLSVLVVPWAWVTVGVAAAVVLAVSAAAARQSQVFAFFTVLSGFVGVCFWVVLLGQASLPSAS